MKKILIILMITFGFAGCATTSTTDTDTVKIKENKLTNLSYVKKICQLTNTIQTGKGVVCEFTEGVFVDTQEGTKVCLIVKDGELYGRWFERTKHGVVVTYNLHDSIAYSVSNNDVQGTWYVPSNILKSFAKSRNAEMNRLAVKWGLSEL